MKFIRRVGAVCARVRRRAAIKIQQSPFEFVLLALLIGCEIGLLYLFQPFIYLRSLYSGVEVQSALKALLTVTDRKISTGFLTDVAAFETAIIAFLIPLSLEMISKISERYKSEVVLRPFYKEWENRVLLKLLLLNVLIALPLRFLHDDKQPIEEWWRFIVWGMLFNFMFTTLTIYSFMSKLRLYMTDTSYIINKLFRDANRSIND